MTQVLPLYVVTHSELTAGYQIAQVAHAVADFALHRTEQFRNWHETSQYIVALQTDNSESLLQLIENAPQHSDTIVFKEPDLGNSITSVVFVPHEQNRRYLANLKLAGIRTGKTNKNSYMKTAATSHSTKGTIK